MAQAEAEEKWVVITRITSGSHQKNISEEDFEDTVKAITDRLNAKGVEVVWITPSQQARLVASSEEGASNLSKVIHRQERAGNLKVQRRKL